MTLFQVKRSTPEHVVPSLYWQGYTAWTTGFQCRPVFENQVEVYMTLQKLFLDGHGIHCLPSIEFQVPNQLRFGKRVGILCRTESKDETGNAQSPNKS